MDLKELTVLRSGLKLFAGSVAKVAERSGVTPAYVTRTLRGMTGENETTLLIIQKAKEVYEEYSQTNNQVADQLSGMD
jgi:transcriptional regulator with XRE-family HTH domain